VERLRLSLILFLICLSGGCTRAFYRFRADRDTYSAINERDHDPRWDLPRISVDTPPQSRLHDPFNPDHPPMPPDDPAAHRYMHWANGMRGYRHWHKDGDAPWIEDPAWLSALPLNEEGILMLTPDRAVATGLLNSRDYQTQIETLYLTGLALTLNRFDFAVHWFGTNNTNWTHFGSKSDESNLLTIQNSAGFTKNFPAGAQLLVDFLNTFMIEFAGPDHMSVVSNIAVNFVQPVLRGAGRDVRMEGLTQAERNLLYAVRTFERFRKQFSFDAITQNYLQLLLLEQAIRNQRANLQSLEQSLRLHEALYAAGTVSTIQVDQVFQSLQSARLTLLQQETALENQRDLYKDELGLPAYIRVRLDDSQLSAFLLAAPALTSLQDELEKFLAGYRELEEPPPLPQLSKGFTELLAFQNRVVKLTEQVDQELERWRGQIPQTPEDGDAERLNRELNAHKTLSGQLKEVQRDLAVIAQTIAKDTAGLPQKDRRTSWQALQGAARQLIAAAGQLFVIQTQARVYLIKLAPMNYEEAGATQEALEARLDLMNQRAGVVDAWRQIWVTANSLEAGLNLLFNMTLSNTPRSVDKPLNSNPVDFRAFASSYQVGFNFDSPLNRYLEQNAYRASLIAYQRARRSYMALEDQIRIQIRRDLRQLKLDRLNFDIQRQSLISAARQVEASRDRLLVIQDAADTTGTLNLLNALQALVSAQNGLIGSWISYETDRYRLLLDMERLQVDPQGRYINERNDQSNTATQQDQPTLLPAPTPVR
jgi:outer membrane protein TolC